MSKLIPDTSQASVAKGIWLIHPDGENTIQIWGSNISGKEEVYLNEQLVSQKRNITRTSEHTFHADDGTEYQVIILTTDIVKGSTSYTIKRNGEEIKVFRTRYQRANNNFMLLLTIVIVVSAIFALLKTTYHWPQYTQYIFIIAVPVLYMLTRKKGQITIEE